MTRTATPAPTPAFAAVVRPPEVVAACWDELEDGVADDELVDDVCTVVLDMVEDVAAELGDPVALASSAFIELRSGSPLTTSLVGLEHAGEPSEFTPQQSHWLLVKTMSPLVYEAKTSLMEKR